MAKDVNIHVKTQGAQQAKSDLQGVARSAEEMGTKTSRASKWIADGFKSLIGPLGFAAIATSIAAVAGKIAKFFDELKTRCDEAVRNLQDVRKGFEGLFEAMNAFDEASRQRVSKEAVGLLKTTAVSSAVGLPVIEAYARQFRGKMSEGQYQQGLEGMLGYAARHGGAATPELIALMSGWGMVTPGTQGAFRRQVAAAASSSGLTDADIIMALGRGMPTVKAMGWTPEQALSSIAAIAAGETGRVKSSLPATTLQALMAPQLSNLKKYKITEAQAESPQQLLQLLALKSQGMDRQAVNRMLTEIYGMEAGKGVYKMLMPQATGIGEALGRAATGKGIAAEMAEEATSRKTEERLQAQTEAARTLTDMAVTDRWRYEQKLRIIGEAEKKHYQREQPKSQWLRELLTVGNEAEKEEAAFRRWYGSLTPEEIDAINRHVWDIEPLETSGQFRGAEYVWNREMNPEQKYESLIGGPRVPTTIINNYYSNDIHYDARIGESQPRAGRELGR